MQGPDQGSSAAPLWRRPLAVSHRCEGCGEGGGEKAAAVSAGGRGIAPLATAPALSDCRPLPVCEGRRRLFGGRLERPWTALAATPAPADTPDAGAEDSDPGRTVTVHGPWPVTVAGGGTGCRARSTVRVTDTVARWPSRGCSGTRRSEPAHRQLPPPAAWSRPAAALRRPCEAAALRAGQAGTVLKVDHGAQGRPARACKGRSPSPGPGDSLDPSPPRRHGGGVSPLGPGQSGTASGAPRPSQPGA